MKTQNLLLVFFVLNFIHSPGLAQNLDWSLSMGDTENDMSLAMSLGNDYVLYTGYFYGTVDFDPGPGVYNLTSNGADDIFVLKLDYNGDFIWAKSLGSGGDDLGWDITHDNFDNVYITGYFKYFMDFDPGPGVVIDTSKGEQDVFLLKLDVSGNYLWSKVFGGIEYDTGRGVSIDESGNSIVTGYFKDTVDFDPGVDTLEIGSKGNYDIFVEKFSPNGNLIWVKTVGGDDENFSYSILSDSLNNYYITGATSGTGDFNPNFGVNNIVSNGGRDAYVLKLDSTGSYEWSYSMGGTGHDNAFDSHMDNFGNILISGSITGVSDLNPGPMVQTYISDSNGDIFVQKITSSGNLVWAFGVGGNNFDYAHSVSTDSLGNIYIVGNFRDSCDLNPGFGNTLLYSQYSTWDIYAAKYNVDGNYVWSMSFPSNDQDYGYGIGIDDNYSVYITGGFNSVIDFDPSSNISQHITNGFYSDIYAAKYQTYLKPVACLSSVPGLVLCNQSYSFNAGCSFHEDTTLSIVLYEWDFNNDGSFDDTGISASYMFTSPEAVKLRVTDSNGKMDSTYTLISILDTVAPIPDSSTLTNLVGPCTVSPNIPTSTDNCAGSINGVPDISLPVSTIGNHIINWSFSDGFNTTYQAQNISVIDTIPPTASDPDSVTVPCFQDVPIPNPNVIIDETDNCGIGNIIHISDSTSGNNCTNQMIHRKYSVFDNAGNYIDVVQVIVIEASYPTISAGNDTIICQNDYVTLQAQNPDSSMISWSGGIVDGIPFSPASGNNEYILTASTCNSQCVIYDSVNVQVNGLDTSVTLMSNQLESNALGVSYQWLDCNSAFSPIPGETSQLFIPLINGLYAVQVYDSICSDTSSCHLIESIGFDENELIFIDKIYPNPSGSYINIPVTNNNDYSDAKLYISNMLGEVICIVFEGNLNTGKSVFSIDISAYSSGLYQVVLLQEDQRIIEKLIIEN